MGANVATVGDLLAFWKRLPADANIHPSDAPLLASRRHRLLTDYVPGPWYGAIRRARVFILTLNPGFVPGVDDVHYRDAEFADLMRRRARGYDVERNLYICNERLRTKGHDWFNARLRGVATAADLSTKFCVLNLVAYRSREFKDRALIDILPSCRLVRDVVRDDILVRARAGKAMLVATRSLRGWGLDGERQTETVRLFRGGETRGAYMSLNTTHGQAIINFLADTQAG